MSEEVAVVEEKEKVTLEKPGRLQRTYFWTNIERVFVLVFLVLSIYGFAVSLAGIASALFLVLYTLVVFCLSAFIVIFTLGLIFTIEGNIVTKMWDVITNYDIKKIEAFQYATLPGLAIATSIFLVLSLLLVILNRKNLKKKANVILLCIGGSFYLVMMFITIMTFASKQL